MKYLPESFWGKVLVVIVLGMIAIGLIQLLAAVLVYLLIGVAVAIVGFAGLMLYRLYKWRI